jgi:hypothetical protein
MLSFIHGLKACRPLRFETAATLEQESLKIGRVWV